MRLRSLILTGVLLTTGCRNGAEKNVPTAPSTSTSASTLSAPPTPIAKVPFWHWMNPQPQGNSLWAAVANHECGVVAVGEQSTVMRSTDDGLTWQISQAGERWRYKGAALSGTDLYVIGDDSSGSVILKIGSCGAAAPIIMRKLAYKADGAANGIAADSEGRVYVTTVLKAEGKMLCSKPKSLDLSVCDDQPNTPFYGLFVDHTDRVFVAGGYQGKAGGVVRSTADHGATWKTLGQHLGSIVYGIWGDESGKRLFATSPGELHASMDSGATWKTSPASMMSGGSMMLGKDDAPYVPNDFDVFIYGASDTGTYFIAAGGVLRGEKFQTTSAPLSVTDGSVSFDAAVSTGNGHWIGVGGTGRINRSTDDGKTWTHISKDVLPDGDQFVNIQTDAKSMFILRRAAFLRSDDNGASFVNLGKEEAPDIQISTRDYVSFALDHDVVVLPRPKSNAIARSTDRGKTFTEIPPTLAAGQSIVHVWSAGSGVFYGSGANGAIFRSEDNALTFKPLSLTTTQDLAAGVTSGHDVYVVGSASGSTGGFHHSSDDGKTWTSVPLDFEPFGVALSDSDIYVIDRYGKFVRSSDQGKSWTKTIDLNCGDVNGLVVQDAHIFVNCNSGRLYTSNDRGTTFTNAPIAADVELLFSDGHAGLFATSSRGFHQLLHYF